MTGTGFSWQQDDPHEEANAWVAKFAPLVMADGAILGAADIRSRLDLVAQLRAAAPAIQQKLAPSGGQPDELSSTLGQAAGQLDSIESDLRKRLALLAPGDPAGIVNLDAIQEKLHEREARQELGAPTDTTQPPVLELQTASGNFASAAFMGVFSLAWLSFTTVHATLMIGGMVKTVGYMGLGLLGFYALFYLAGLAMAYSALNAASSENIVLSGNQLSVIRRLGSWVRTKRYVLPKDARAEVTYTGNSTYTGYNSSQRMTEAIVLGDVGGKQINLGTNGNHVQRTSACEKINAYLAADAAAH